MVKDSRLTGRECDAVKSIEAAILKCDRLAREMNIPDTNHTWSKLRMFLVDALEVLR